MSSSKPHLNMVIVGHVDHGKSTTTGHLMYLMGLVDERKMQELAAESAKTGVGETFKFAWVLDHLKDERERGVTIDTEYVKFETPKYYFTIIDAPGHRDFIKNMITGASQADAAILVVSAKKGEFETGISPEGQTVEHSFLLFTLGVRQIVVAVNLFTRIGFDLKKVNIPIVPISGWTGDNLVKPSPNMPWYKGPTLLESFDVFTIPPKPLDKPLRLPVQDVYSITGVGTVPVGRVESGVLKVNDEIIFMPSKKTGQVKSIEMHHTAIERAEPGDNIGFNVKGIAKNEIRRGEVASLVSSPAPIVKEFIGQIIVIRHPTAIAKNYTPVLHVHTEQVACTFVDLLRKFDPRTGASIQEKPDFLRTGDGALVKLRPMRPISVETYADNPALGRFAIRDMGITIAAGIIKEITEKG
ncbi:MAG: elongation factor 1-alpha [Thermoproteota archaeon]